MNNEIVKAEKYELTNTAQVLELAGVIADYIKERKLSVRIRGNDYVKAEGWQFAGNNLGIVPLITTTMNLSNDDEIKYQAEVDLKKLSDGNIVGRGVAICSNKEANKKTFDEYAILSMAQTRAIGKAYRNLLAWLITAAGYSPTPAEEMDFEDKSVKTVTDIDGNKIVIIEKIESLFQQHSDNFTDDIKRRIKQKIFGKPMLDKKFLQTKAITVLSGWADKLEELLNDLIKLDDDNKIIDCINNYGKNDLTFGGE